MHRILEFNDSQWSKPYIEFNTQKRIEAEKDSDNKSKLLLTDTDSLMYEIKTEDVYKDLIKKCLILGIIRLSQNTMMIQTN